MNHAGRYHGRGPTAYGLSIDGLTAGSDKFSDKIGRTYTRSGTPPRITIDQEINCYGGFSGTLKDGRLVGVVNDVVV